MGNRFHVIRTKRVHLTAVELLLSVFGLVLMKYPFQGIAPRGNNHLQLSSPHTSCVILVTSLLKLSVPSLGLSNVN